MIRYALRCDRDHGFESWFKSASAYDALKTAGQVACPQCGSATVEKALMAPAVPPKAQKAALTAPATPKEAALAELRRQVETNSEYVGMNFAAEARKKQEEEAARLRAEEEARQAEARRQLEEEERVARERKEAELLEV